MDMELITDRMKMGDLRLLERLLAHYKKVPEEGLFYGLTANAKHSWFDHADEERWAEMILLFVTKSHDDIIEAERVFHRWAAEAHPGKPVTRVGDPMLPEGSSRYWIYVVR